MKPRVVRWFPPGLHVKRWLGLLILGMVIISLGIGYALRNFYSSGFRFPGVTFYLTLQFIPYVARAALFGALGLSIILFALYKLTQSVLGPFLPVRDRALSEIIYNYRFRQRGARVVALGWGMGLSTMLRGLRMYTGITPALVTEAVHVVTYSMARMVRGSWGCGSARGEVCAGRAPSSTRRRRRRSSTPR